MAKNNEKRPVRRLDIMGGRLTSYTDKHNKSYDPIFDKQIRKLRPDWFK